jgi:hypothetical protein
VKIGGKVMKKRAWMIFLIIFFLTGCGESLFIDTSKNTYYDDIADITYVNDHFFTTNYDLSGHSGSQIDLMKFTSDGSAFDDSYDLEMNGQGYFAMTSDGTDIYLQSRNNGGIFRVSTIGERIYVTTDSVSPEEWQSSGICYLSEKDSLLLLYRNLSDRTEYRARTVSKTALLPAGTDLTFHIGFIDTTYFGIWAISVKDSAFYMLGVDTLLQDKLIITDLQFNVTATEDIPDSTVVGLCFKADELYLSYRRRHIAGWQVY